MQSPQGPPGDGQAVVPHVPLSHVPVQHSPFVMQAAPSILHCVPQTPDGPHDPLQQSTGDMHGVPSGWQASWHVPPIQVPVQQFDPIAHIPPRGVHVPQFAPQRLSASWTQI